jgi:hypothetical protein
MGNLFKSKTTTTKDPFETNPWEAQQPYLKQGFSSASDALSGALASNANITDYTADMTSDQIADLERIRANSAATTGMTQGALATGQSGLHLTNQAGFNASNLARTAGLDPTQQIIGNAQSYANDPYLQSQIDASLSDVSRAFEQTRGSINSSATGTGNINSTRAGTLEAYAKDDAMDRASQIASSMRGEAYQSGLDRATNTYQNTFNNQLSANSALSAAGQTSFNTGVTGYGLGSQAAQDALAASTAYQTQNQNEINGQIAGNQTSLDLINQYMQAVGGSYGNNGYTSTTTKSASPFQQIIGGVATIAGLGSKKE